MKLRPPLSSGKLGRGSAEPGRDGPDGFPLGAKAWVQTLVNDTKGEGMRGGLTTADSPVFPDDATTWSSIFVSTLFFNQKFQPLSCIAKRCNHLVGPGFESNPFNACIRCKCIQCLAGAPGASLAFLRDALDARGARGKD
ncbi:hypothetical protein COCOBI_pt-0600 (chloroplast) [Coccomyxa sp. Obi]|nr:hypothetical protein COCOBI_pt-0600 [Coccomyxa sp. Obi]